MKQMTFADAEYTGKKRKREQIYLSGRLAASGRFRPATLAASGWELPITTFFKRSRRMLINVKAARDNAVHYCPH